MPTGVDVFVSYTEQDAEWAEWVAAELEAMGLSTRLQAWDFGAGRDWMHEMHVATTESRRTVAILSRAYLESEHGGIEWRTALAADPSGELQRLIPIRVEACELPGLLRTRVFVDLVDVDKDTARERLATAFAGSGTRRRPGGTPFPRGRRSRGWPRVPIGVVAGATTAALAATMFNLSESGSTQQAARAGPEPTNGAAPLSLFKGTSRGGSANPIGELCALLHTHEEDRLHDTETLLDQLDTAGTGEDQVGALLFVLENTRNRSRSARAAFDEATAERATDTRRSVMSAWRHGLGLVERFSDALHGATTYGDLVAAAAEYGDNRRRLDDDWERVSVGLSRLGGAECRYRSRGTAPVVRLRGPELSIAELDVVPLVIAYDPDVTIGRALDILEPSAGLLGRVVARRESGGDRGERRATSRPPWSSNSTVRPTPTPPRPVPKLPRPTATPAPIVIDG